MNPTLLLAIPMLPLIAAHWSRAVAGKAIGRAAAAAVTIGRSGASPCAVLPGARTRMLVDQLAELTTARSTPGW